MFKYLALVTVLFHSGADANRLDFYNCTDKGQVTSLIEKDNGAVSYMVELQCAVNQTVEVEQSWIKARK